MKNYFPESGNDASIESYDVWWYGNEQQVDSCQQYPKDPYENGCDCSCYGSYKETGLVPNRIYDPTSVAFPIWCENKNTSDRRKCCAKEGIDCAYSWNKVPPNYPTDFTGGKVCRGGAHQLDKLECSSNHICKRELSHEGGPCGPTIDCVNTEVVWSKYPDELLPSAQRANDDYRTPRRDWDGSFYISLECVKDNRAKLIAWSSPRQYTASDGICSAKPAGEGKKCNRSIYKPRPCKADLECVIDGCCKGGDLFDTEDHRDKGNSVGVCLPPAEHNAVCSNSLIFPRTCSGDCSGGTGTTCTQHSFKDNCEDESGASCTWTATLRCKVAQLDADKDKEKTIGYCLKDGEDRVKEEDLLSAGKLPCKANEVRVDFDCVC